MTNYFIDSISPYPCIIDSGSSVSLFPDSERIFQFTVQPIIESFQLLEHFPQLSKSILLDLIGHLSSPTSTLLFLATISYEIFQISMDSIILQSLTPSLKTEIEHSFQPFILLTIPTTSFTAGYCKYIPIEFSQRFTPFESLRSNKTKYLITATYALSYFKSILECNVIILRVS